jgi:hypothetical protein
LNPSSSYFYIFFFFFKLMLRFLERVVSEEGISTGPDKVKTVQNWPRLPGDVNTSFSLMKACSHSSFN